MEVWERYYIELYTFEGGSQNLRGYTSLKNAIDYAQNKIKEGYDKVTIYDYKGRVDRVYWNINGEARRL